jgi:hypothetical protein
VHGSIGGMRDARISAQVQILCHLGHVPTSQDARDVLALCRAFDLPLPKPYASFGA